LSPLFSKIDDSSKKIDRTGAKTISPGDLNHTVVKIAKIKLKTKDFKKIFLKKFIVRNAIRIEIKKYSDQNTIIKYSK